MIITILTIIINFIITNIKEVIIMVIEAKSIEKILIVILFIIPIPFTMEGYLIMKRFITIRKKRA